ncbi:MAG: hypothetical protein HYZ24_17565 [Chloroflexi bacterium]|nr:hypothetical protein [Chloroflexota bacterium]
MVKETKNIHSRFWTEWLILNLLGWAIGIFFVYLIAGKLEDIHEYAVEYGLANNNRSVWYGGDALLFFPLGLCIGFMQWVKLRRLNVNLFAWAFLTACGTAIANVVLSWIAIDLFRALYNLFEIFQSDYQKWIDIVFKISNASSWVSFPIGGMILGVFQSFAIRLHISKSSKWIRANALGLLVPSLPLPFGYTIKSFILNFFYSAELSELVDIRWPLFYGYLVLVSAISIAKFTGDIILKEETKPIPT